MPDLLTHAAVGALVRARAPWQSVGWFVLGSMLPDLSSRLPSLGLVAVTTALDLPVSLPLLEGMNVCHAPLPYLVLCGLVALLLPLADRVTAWWGLSTAGLLHLALDTTQTHLQPGYPLLFPFSTGQWELGWVHAELSLKLLPLTGLVVAVVFGVRWWRSRGAVKQKRYSK